LNHRPKLSASMSLTQFDHGYWYATELKRFARGLGVPSPTRLRKDELEHAIRQFLRSGTIGDPTPPAPRQSVRPKPRDSELGLRLDRRIVRYTNDQATKAFLEREAKRIDPAFRRRSGAMYRLNRWREAQLSDGVALTYRALVKEYVRLSRSTERFAQIPHGRYINFLSDFMAHRPGATQAEVIAAWKEVKTMDCPKTYRDWSMARFRRP
jgi:SAP domain-containing new25